MTSHAIAAAGSARDTWHMPHEDTADTTAEPSFRALVRELTREWAPRFPAVGRRLHPDLFAAENAEESWGWDVGGRRAWMTHDGQTRTVDLTGIKEGRDALERIRVHQPEAMPEAFAIAWHAAAHSARLHAHYRGGCPGGCPADCKVQGTLRAAIDAQIIELTRMAARVVDAPARGPR